MQNAAWQREAVDDEEEEISRDEESTLVLPSSMSTAEQLRREMMTDDEEDATPAETTDDHTKTATSSKSKAAIGDQAAAKGDQAAAEGDQATANESQTAAETTGRQPPIDDSQTDAQTESSQQTALEEQQAVGSQNGQSRLASQENSDDFYVSIESFSTPPESINIHPESQAAGGQPPASINGHPESQAAVGQPPASNNQQPNSQRPNSQQPVLNSQQLGSDLLGSSILASLDDEERTVTQNSDDGAIEETGWVSAESVHAFKYKFKAGRTTKNKIAAFDLDGTLIVPKSNAKFSKDINDWKLKDAGLKKKIAGLVKEGYNFVIISNQMGVSYRFMTLKQVKTKFENIVRHIDQPCVALLCTSQDRGRKPAIGMLEFYRTINTTKLDLQQSFYVGDAMGRPRDHSAADLLFAFNCRMPFVAIESFLSGFEKPKLFTYEQLSKFKVPAYPIDPSKMTQPQILTKKRTPDEADIDFFSCEELVDSIESKLADGQLCVLLLIGLFGSGKSHFAKKYLELNYHVIEHEAGAKFEDDRDLFQRHVAEGRKRIAIDYPNLDFKERKRWIDLAKAEKALVIGVHFDLPVDMCAHNVRFRSYYTDHDRKAPTPNQILKQHTAFRTPDFFEGFSQIYKLDFIPTFDVPQKRVYHSHFLYDKP